MKFTSILDLKETEKDKQPVFLQDLNIDRIIKEIQNKNSGYEVEKLFRYFPADKESEEYRREVLRDLKNRKTAEVLESFSDRMLEVKKSRSNAENAEHRLQEKVCHLEAVTAYAESVIFLKEELEAQKPKSRGLKNFLEYVDEYMQSEGFIYMKEEALPAGKEIKEMTLVLMIENNRISVCEGKVEGLYEKSLCTEGSGKNHKLLSPFVSDKDISYLEDEIYKIISRNNPQLFRRIEKLADETVGFMDEKISEFTEEIQFYLSFLKFEREMQESGFSFAEPVCPADGSMCGEEVYDLALAVVNRKTDTPVIANSYEYREGERFFVLNGPNQGGKTTFARSLGQQVYFAKAGLDVPAKSACIPYFENIHTHFSVEESMETGRGKLMEELLRLKPMMEEEKGAAFVVINELFTTAANYDAYIMGRRVLDFFMEKQCMGIYVTHIFELAGEKDGIVSLRAQLDEKDYHKRTYKILRGEAEELGYAGDIVEKYQLTYRQLKERFENKEGSADR